MAIEFTSEDDEAAWLDAACAVLSNDALANVIMGDIAPVAIQAADLIVTAMQARRPDHVPPAEPDTSDEVEPH